jgi:hypothetical protein
MAPVGPYDALGLLRAAGPAERLALLEGHLSDLEQVLATRRDGG